MAVRDCDGCGDSICDDHCCSYDYEHYSGETGEWVIEEYYFCLDCEDDVGFCDHCAKPTTNECLEGTEAVCKTCAGNKDGRCEHHWYYYNDIGD